jgi:hypothetical protein
MKKIIIAFLSLVQIISIQAQTVRYLEKKDYEKEAGSNMVMVMPSISEDYNRLAISTSKTDFSKNFKEIKMAFSTKVINLKTGRLELNQDKLSASYLRNELIVADYSTLNDAWIESGKLLGQVAGAPYYVLMPESNGKKYMSKPPAGYYPCLPIGKYWVFMSADAQKPSTVLAQEINNQFQIIYKFGINGGKLSPDSSAVYGVNTQEKNVKVYSVQDGKLLQKIEFKEIPIDVIMLSDGKLFCKFMDFQEKGMIVHSAKIISPDGLTTLKIFPNLESLTEILDNGKEMVSVSPSGNIKLIDIATGELITETKDTYITAGANLSSPYEKGKKSVNMKIVKIQGGDFFLIPYSTGIMSLFSTKERKVVANIFTDMDDWAIIAKDGRVDGTSGAFDKLEWREYDRDNLIKKTSLESTFDKYYTPRLLYTIISGEGAKMKSFIGEDVAQVPTLIFERINGQKPFVNAGEILNYNAKGKNLTLDIHASTNLDQIKEVRLYQNNKLVSLQTASTDGKYSFKVSLNTVYGGKNSLYVIAGTKQGIDSEKLKMMVDYTSDVGAKSKLYVLVVGINKYQNPKYQLNYALPDAEAFKKQFADNPSVLFESIIVKSLFDDEASKERIAQAFKDLSTAVREQDMFIFYYAGHGTMGGNTLNPEFYIVPYDVTQLYGNENILKEKALSAGEIKTLSIGLVAQKQVFIIDACHSAGALESAVTRGAAEERAIGQLARSTGTFWLTAAGSDQFATEFEKLGHGVFTYSLLEALQGKDSGSAMDGTITIRELSSYVEQRVPELSIKFKGSPQYPASFSFGNDFPIAIQSEKK